MKSLSHTRIYLDHAATTPVDDRVWQAMLPFFCERYGNPNSGHARGREARAALDHARQLTAGFLGARFEEIVFTGGGTEADNLALMGVALHQFPNRGHLVTSAIEHHAVLHTCRFLETLGYSVTYLPVDENGTIDPASVEAALRDDTILVSIMMANNELGVVQPIAEIGRRVRVREIPFHTDAVQAAGTLPLNVDHLNVDLLSLSAHKIYGPKGAGALYIRRGVRMVPHLHGGEQERGRRSGTENVGALVGLGVACELTAERRQADCQSFRSLRDEFERQVVSRIGASYANCSDAERLSSHSHLRFDGVSSETLLMSLDLAGIAASAGSACTSGAAEPSHVLRALGLNDAQARSSVRFSFGRTNRTEHVEAVVAVLEAAVKKQRAK